MSKITSLVIWLCVLGGSICVGASTEKGFVSALPSAQSAALPLEAQFAPSSALSKDQSAYHVLPMTRARYPLVIDQFIQQAKFTATDGAAGDLFGNDSALSADGSTAIVSSHYADVGGNLDQGAAYVFTRSGSSWIQQAKLTAADGAANDRFGISVALSGDGNTAIIGAWYADVGGNADQGAAYVFTRSGAAWSQYAKLIAADGAAYASFGASVALSGDGNTAIVGAWYAHVGGNADQGAAYVFTHSGVSWNQQVKLLAADGAANDFFGRSVALNDDGNAAIASAYSADVGGNPNQGAAYVFTRSGVAWNPQAKLVAADGAADDLFGVSVALSADGKTAIVGAHYADVGGNADQGAAYMFRYSGTAWEQHQKLTAADGAASDYFGVSVGLSSDGNSAITGVAYADVGGNPNQGAAYVFLRSGAFWSQQAKLIAADGAAGDLFGISAALSGDGNSAIAGAYFADVDSKANQGAAYVFAVCTLQFELPAHTVLEDAGSVRVSVTRANVASGAVSVNYATADGTAVAGTDYTATSGTLSWPDGNIDTKSIRVPIVNRSGMQGSRAFSITLSGASGASLGSPAVTTVTIKDPRVGPKIKANGSGNDITVNFPEPVTITVSMTAGIYAGSEVDWWVVAFAHSGGWYYLDSAMQWTSFSGDLAHCQPVYQGPLIDLSSTPVLSGYQLPRGTYDFWFAVDYPMDGILNLNGPILYNSVSVIVQ